MIIKYWLRVFTYLIQGPRFYNGGDAPKAPDYVGAAREQGKYNLLAAQQTGMLNNPDVNNPYGDQTVTWKTVGGTKGHYVGKGKSRKWVPGKGGSKVPSITQTLKPAQQALLDKSNAAKLTLADSAQNAANQILANSGKPLDFSGLPGGKTGEMYRQDVIDAMMGRVNQDYKLQNEDTISQLIAAGLRPGTAAYETAMDRNNRGLNDARQQAIIAGGQEASRVQGMDMETRQQLINEMMAQRQTPINEMNAVLSGSQVNNPFAGGLGYQGGASVSPTNYAGAVGQQGQSAINQYNQNQAFNNSNLQAGAGLLGSLGSAALYR